MGSIRFIANWQSYKTAKDISTWVEEFEYHYNPQPDVEIIIAPASILLHELQRTLQSYQLHDIRLAVQDISPFPFGNYTGAIAAPMVEGIAEYAIVGHSSRRRFFHETDMEIANKVFEAAAVNITPLICVDMPYARSQKAALGEQHKGLIVYEPVEAIGVETYQSPENVKKSIGKICEIFQVDSVCYGGAVNSDNATDYLAIDKVNSLLVGSSSLDPIEFAKICLYP